MLQFDCINHYNSRVSFILDGQLIRTSYLWSDTVRVSGTSYMALDFEKQYANAGAWLKKRMVLGYASRVPDPAYLKEVEKIYETISLGRKNVKHATTQMIIARKKCELLLEQLYENSKQDMRAYYTTCGYAGLMPLVDEDAILLWGSSADKPESSEGNAVPYSECLASKWEQDGDELYSFTDLFSKYAEEKRITLHSFEEGEENADVFLFPLVNTVPLDSFSANELKAIKQEVFGDMPDLRAAMEDWSLQLSKENFSAEGGAHYRNFYATRILPHLSKVRERMEKSLLIGKINSLLRGQVGFENYLAVTSARITWDFMEWSGMVPRESMHAFEENLPEGCDGNKAVLLFMSKSFNHQPAEETGDKKSLQL